MGIIGGPLGYLTLRTIAPRARSSMRDATRTELDRKLERLLDQDVYQLIQGKTVVDFGCGLGYEAVEMARGGAAKVIGLDILDHHLEHARRHAEECGVAQRCVFAKEPVGQADVVISLAAFEHFDDPAGVLDAMAGMLNPGGRVLTAFGPTWLHPFGGHLFSVFPWSHILFSEEAQIRWRSDFKSDGATRFSEVAGGLNQMTIRKFERLVEESSLEFEWIETVPIRGVRLLKTRALREIGTSVVRCVLKPIKSCSVAL